MLTSKYPNALTIWTLDRLSNKLFININKITVSTQLGITTFRKKNADI